MRFTSHRLASRQLKRFLSIAVAVSVATTIAIALPTASLFAPIAPLFAQESRTQRIRFAPGKDSATVRSAVVRGTRDIYVLGASKGQVMTVKIFSVENNALFHVLAPANSNGQRRPLREGVVLWNGRLPETGDYQLVVGSSRGNATYQLQVIIR